MSIIEKVQNIQIDSVKNDGNLQKLNDALQYYHKLIDEGKLIPRKNTIDNSYNTFSFKHNTNEIF